MSNLNQTFLPDQTSGQQRPVIANPPIIQTKWGPVVIPQGAVVHGLSTASNNFAAFPSSAIPSFNLIHQQPISQVEIL